MLKIEQNKVRLISGISLLILVLTNSFIKSDFWVICIDVILILVNLVLFIISRDVTKTKLLRKMKKLDEVKWFFVIFRDGRRLMWDRLPSLFFDNVLLIKSKQIPICLLSNSLEVHIFLFQKTRVYKGGFD